jgi:hypothetical protein
LNILTFFQSIDSMNKTPSSVDTQLESDTSTTPSAHYLQLPQSDVAHNYPTRDVSSSYSRSTISSVAKYKVYIHFSPSIESIFY